MARTTRKYFCENFKLLLYCERTYLLVPQWLFINISSSCDHVQKPEGPILEALLSGSTKADKEAMLAALKQLNGHNCMTIFTIV